MVYKDINESIYFFKYQDFKFYFSSKFYLEKFTREYVDFLKNEKLKLRIKYKCDIFGDDILLLLLYRKVDKRGFRVYQNDCELKSSYYAKIEVVG